MSHFTVLVIGPNPEKQLQPYHEFECTGTDDEHVVDVVDDDAYEEDYEDSPVVRPNETPDLSGDAKYRYVRVDAEGNKQFIRRTNPNAKWDWWVVGGRWCGFFPVRADAKGHVVAGAGAGAARGLQAKAGHADQLRVGDVDFDGARNAAAERATTHFDAWQALVTEHGRAKSWTEVRESSSGDISNARDAYHSQPLIQAATQAAQNEVIPRMFVGCYVEMFGYDREVYIARERAAALVPYAILYNGKWLAKGEMGWFGMSDDKVSENDWAQRVSGLYDDLPPDTLLTLVDCHI